MNTHQSNCKPNKNSDHPSPSKQNNQDMFNEKACVYCGESPCWWKKNKGAVENWTDVCLGFEEILDDKTAAYCRKRVRRYVSYKRWGTWNKGKNRSHPQCIKKGIFKMYLPQAQQELFYDKETLKWAKSDK